MILKFHLTKAILHPDFSGCFFAIYIVFQITAVGMLNLLYNNLNYLT
jgi:hypothetical protein